MTQQMQTRTDRFGVPLQGWSFATQSPEVDDCAVITACERCGDAFLTEDPDDDVLCCACSMPPAELAALRMTPAGCPSAPRPACDRCGFFPLRTGDAVRCPACTRLYASLIDVSAARTEDALAA